MWEVGELGCPIALFTYYKQTLFYLVIFPANFTYLCSFTLRIARLWKRSEKQREEVVLRMKFALPNIRSLVCLSFE